MRIQSKHSSGFTLIELLVVIAIISILAAILFPVFAKAREKARQATCESNLKQIGLAMLQYTQDYDEYAVPSCQKNFGFTGGPWVDLIYPYVQSTQVYQCPDVQSATIPGSNAIIVNNNYYPNPALPNGLPVSYACNGGDPGTNAGQGPGNDRPMQELDNAIISSTQYINTATVIMISERRVATASELAANTWDNNPLFYNVTEVPDLQGHTGMTNFLFADGHVKAMKPSETGTPSCLWTYNNASLSTATTTGPCTSYWNTALASVEVANQ
jgi:prepilin-type N-terminal cleavage/methylation domain-containing protein/prepilin-type processing-associated H-X9-DG protein